MDELTGGFATRTLDFFSQFNDKRSFKEPILKIYQQILKIVKELVNILKTRKTRLCKRVGSCPKDQFLVSGVYYCRVLSFRN